MRAALALATVLALAGCAQQRIGVQLYDPAIYQRAEVDAINAEMMCKAQARTSVQMSRCVGNRR